MDPSEFAKLPTNCPWCLRSNNGHAGPEPGDIPAPDDAAICWACKKVAIYVLDGDRLTLRRATPEEAKSLDPAIRGPVREALNVAEAVGMYRRTYS